MKAIIDFNKADSMLRIVRNEAEFKELDKSTRHYISHPNLGYPVLYAGWWWDNPNGPHDIDWIEIAGGECITIVEDEE